jgi:hypothetical protein
MLLSLACARAEEGTRTGTWFLAAPRFYPTGGGPRRAQFFRRGPSFPISGEDAPPISTDRHDGCVCALAVTGRPKPDAGLSIELRAQLGLNQLADRLDGMALTLICPMACGLIDDRDPDRGSHPSPRLSRGQLGAPQAVVSPNAAPPNRLWPMAGQTFSRRYVAAGHTAPCIVDASIKGASSCALY